MTSNAISLILILAACGSIVIASAARDDADAAQKNNGQADVNSQHTKWVADSLQQMQTIKVGMTREQLLQVFQEEGGLSTPRQRTYVYRNCRYFKVDVTFKSQQKLTEQPKDKIVTISRPYLDWSVID